MSTRREAISVRTMRLNNLLTGKIQANPGNENAACGTSKALANRRSTITGIGASNGTINPAVAEAINREGLLDALFVLYNECNKEGHKKRDRRIADFVKKYGIIMSETQKLRVNIEDFTVKTLIGSGNYGTVHLAIERQTGDVYAMKKIKKSAVTTVQVLEERDIMSRRCSEWITSLQYAFQDVENLYLVMEYLPGGDLFGLMERHGPFDEDLSRFYLAELTMAVHSLHMMGYVHRDIKPENILIDRLGHIKLADFGNAATLDRDGFVFSLTPVGTPDYIAPELLQTLATYRLTKSMHDVKCDFWSMGIIGYELICEVTPFHEENVHETYSKILMHCEDSSLKEIIKFPNDLKLSENFKNLIESLVTSRDARLDYEGIRKHPFFESVNWETLRSQVPPIIPTVNGDDDTSNFDVPKSPQMNRCRRSFKRLVGAPATAVSPMGSPSSSSNVTSNDFSGKDLPFIGYSFVHMEKQSQQKQPLHHIDESNLFDEVRYNKMCIKLKDLQAKLKERSDEIVNLKQELVRYEQIAKQSSAQSKLLNDYKEEMNKMKNIIKEKSIELASCKTQIKTLQSSVKVEEEMWEKKEATITDLLRQNRQKYEEAKIASDQRYEKIIAEKKSELSSLNLKLEESNSNLTAKTEECMQLQKKMESYKEMLKQCKEQSQADKLEFEKNKSSIIQTYEQKLTDLRQKLRHEENNKTRLTNELRNTRTELNDSITSTRSTQEAKIATEKSNDEILKRLNQEIQDNNRLHKQIAQLESRLSEFQKQLNEQKQETSRLERELQVVECGKNLAESPLGSSSGLGTATSPTGSPYQTAHGSLNDLRMIEEQLRVDLETAKGNEMVQKERADKLQELVGKLENMLQKLNDVSLSPTKQPHPAPRSHQQQQQSHDMQTEAVSVSDMLERQNEKLEDKLASVREKMIVERQAARTANLSLWKTEKKLDETIAEKKLIEKKLERTEDRIKSIQNERDEARRLQKDAQSEINQHESRIKELRAEIYTLKQDVLKEHKMWEKSEQERMKCKSELTEHLAKVHRSEERLVETQQKLQKLQQKCDGLTLENRRLARELEEERKSTNNSSDKCSKLETELKQLQDNYNVLKYACTLTDNQLSEIEKMLETEQANNKSQKESINKLKSDLATKNDEISRITKELRIEQSSKSLLQVRLHSLTKDLEEQQATNEELQKKIAANNEQNCEQTRTLLEVQERMEILQSDIESLQDMKRNYETELVVLKEENARILSDLYHSREDADRLRNLLKESEVSVQELQQEIDELTAVLSEKESFYLQRDVKAEATLAQHKKLIDYLQLTVEDLQQKKKKTFADRLFGTSSSSSTKKENINPNAIESSILYRTLEEELRREKLRNKSLQAEIEKLSSSNASVLNTTTGNTVPRTPLKSMQGKHHNQDGKTNTKEEKTVEISVKEARSKPEAPVSTTKKPKDIEKQSNGTSFHRFELALKELNNGNDRCCVCDKPVLATSPYWKCRECQDIVHRKCRGDAKNMCGTQKTFEPTAPVIDDSDDKAGKDMDTDADTDVASLGKYSYEPRLDDDFNDPKKGDSNYCGDLIYSPSSLSPHHEHLEIYCGYEIEERKIILFGCNKGLYAYHMHTQKLMHIAGVDSVKHIAVSLPLSKVIMVSSNGESMYQCEYRQLLTRSQANASTKSSLEICNLELPFAYRQKMENWQFVQISDKVENALDSVAIAVTPSYIVVMRFDVKMQKFVPIRSLDVAATSLLFTRHTAIVACDKFYEIDLGDFSVEEFVDFSDSSLKHTDTCQPIAAIAMSKHEFLLCFAECGIFVDEFGCRSRPYDINWEYTPTGFMYCEPLLYVSHFQSVQIIRLERSFSKRLSTAPISNASSSIDTVDGRNAIAAAATADDLKRVHVTNYMPTLLARSGKLNAYTLTLNKRNGEQEIYNINGCEAFKNNMNISIETLTSVGTEMTIESLDTLDRSI